MFVEGPSPSTHIRSRFPLHPSLSAVDGVSIERNQMKGANGFSSPMKWLGLFTATSRLLISSGWELRTGGRSFPRRGNEPFRENRNFSDSSSRFLNISRSSSSNFFTRSDFKSCSRKGDCLRLLIHCSGRSLPTLQDRP